jgi:tetratricopeptide (TPR) repeat protein
MKDPLQNIEMIERYFDNEMSDQEKADFMNEVKNDVELRHLFDRERLLIDTVRFGAAKNNLQFLKDLDTALPSVTIESRTSKWVYYAAAASVTLLIVVGLFVFNADAPDPNKLYAEYFSPYINVFEPTVRGQATPTNRGLAFQKYDEGEYAQAADLFSELVEESAEPGMLMLLGNSYLAIGQTQKAIPVFDDLAKKSSDLRFSAKWYLSLCHLAAGDQQKATQILQWLAATDNAYQTKAHHILERLE